jgi:hypothetical protein
VRQIPGKIKGFFAGAGGWLVNAGKQLLQGLANGIKDAAMAPLNAAKGVVGKLKGLLPGSPVKWGPLTSWNNGGAGVRLMGMLESGIRKGQVGVTSALVSALKVPTDMQGGAHALGKSTTKSLLYGYTAKELRSGVLQDDRYEPSDPRSRAFMSPAARAAELARRASAQGGGASGTPRTAAPRGPGGASPSELHIHLHGVSALMSKAELGKLLDEAVREMLQRGINPKSIAVKRAGAY